MTYKCCICGREFEGYGNNAEPLRRSKTKPFKAGEDKCCHECNSNFVIPFRVAIATNNTVEMKRVQNEVFQQVRKGNKRK